MSMQAFDFASLTASKVMSEGYWSLLPMRVCYFLDCLRVSATTLRFVATIVAVAELVICQARTPRLSPKIGLSHLFSMCVFMFIISQGKFVVSSWTRARGQ